MSITLNIGMRTHDGHDLSARHVQCAVRRIFPGTRLFRIVPAEIGEDTLVVRLSHHTIGADNYYGIIGRIYELACDLQQDCIAVSGTGNWMNPGRLIGPNAVAWGEFVPSLFHDWDDAQRLDEVTS